MIGPPNAVAKVVLANPPLSVALFILMIEWMTQSHYVDSVRGESRLDPLFANLLRCHWIEEAQHAKLDTLMVEALADGKSEEEDPRSGHRPHRHHQLLRHRLQAAGQVQPRRAGARHRAQARRGGARNAARTAAPGPQMDLSGVRPGHKGNSAPRSARYPGPSSIASTG
jgi:hypothetical protein